MEPIKKTYAAVYYDCGIDTHRHKTKEIAQNCINRNANKKKGIPHIVVKARRILIAKEILNGKSFREAAALYNIHPSTAKNGFHTAINVTKIVMRKHKNTIFPKESWLYSVNDYRKEKDFWLNQINYAEPFLFNGQTAEDIYKTKQGAE